MLLSVRRVHTGPGAQGMMQCRMHAWHRALATPCVALSQAQAKNASSVPCMRTWWHRARAFLLVQGAGTLHAPGVQGICVICTPLTKEVGLAASRAVCLLCALAQALQNKTTIPCNEKRGQSTLLCGMIQQAPLSCAALARENVARRHSQGGGPACGIL